MDTVLPTDWQPWRDPSPLGGARPTKTDLHHAVETDARLQDVLPYPADQDNAGLLRLLIVGTNPSPWAASVKGPFGRPGNRFWASLHAGGITTQLVDASRGLDRADEFMLAQRGVGITNIVSRPSSRSDELSRQELRDGSAMLIQRVTVLRPKAVAFTGITAFRNAFQHPKATLGRQDTTTIPGWPQGVEFWVMPDPSGLNAHESVSSLGDKWHQVWQATAS